MNRCVRNNLSRSRSITSGLLLCVVCVGTLAPGLSAQEKPAGSSAGDRPYFKTIPLHGFATKEEVDVALINGATVPMWTYQVTAQQDGVAYTGTMIGGNAPWMGSTNISTKIIPLIIHTPDGFTFDPTAPDPCAAAPLTNTSDLTLFQQSPIFVNHSYTMNGVNVGNTQYIDAFQRANFWNNGTSPFNTLLNPVTTLGAHTITVPSGSGTSVAAPCGRQGRVDVDYLQNYLEQTLIPSLASSGVTTTTLPIFLLSNVVMTQGGCCIGGYHSAFNSGGSIQTYLVTDFETSGYFGSFAGFTDSAVATHEVGEWLDDPLGGNPTPPWGHIGQVSGCQDNLEDGDALTGTVLNVAMPNGYTYHVQELAFFSWFFGGASLGAGGAYSSNGTFTGPAVLCAFTVTLSASNTSPPAGTAVTLTATANQDVGPTPYYILIFDGGTIIQRCGSGTTCAITVNSATATTKTYVAKIAEFDGSFVQATSPPVPVTWGAPTMQVTPAGNIVASGARGGPFFPSAFQYQLSMTTGSANFSIGGVPSWLTASATSGPLTTSATTITFTVNATANGLALGTYGPSTITFSNTTSGQGNTTRTATLAVGRVPGDFDGDARRDLAVYRPTTGEWFIFGSATGFQTRVFGAPSASGLGDIPVPAEFDGEGKTDLAIYRQATGEWFIFGSATGFQTRVFGAPAASGLGDTPVPADFDGDLKTDVAIYRKATAEWFIFGSATGFRTTVFGAPAASGLGDTPVPGDFDGDGKADIAVRRSATAEWFVLQSLTGQTQTVTFGAPSDLPLPQPAQ